MRRLICALIFMGSLWQLEIADLNLLNGNVPFGYLCSSIIVENNWAVRDFFMALMITAFIVVAIPDGVIDKIKSRLVRK